MKQVLMFPGQGAQCVGMGADLADAETGRLANEICGIDLLRAMREGPEELINSTRYSQPALFLASVWVLKALAARGIKPSADYYLGLSLGEYTALYAAGVLSFEDALRALAVRGSAMQRACLERPGGMLTVLGLGDDEVVAALAKVTGKGVLQAANFNAPGQVVVSGEAAALEAATTALKEAGAKRVLPLKVAGAFHSPLMAPAEAELGACLATCRFNPGAGRVIANVTGLPHEDGKVADLLLRQVSSPVRLSQSIAWLAAQGVSRFVELGTGKVLCGLVKRGAPEAELLAAGTAAEVAALAL